LFLGISGYILSRLKRARWIFNVSDLWPESAVHLGVVGEGRSLKLAWALEAFCYRKAWLVTGQSREILENIRRRFPQVPTYHLSGGVDTTLFSPLHHSAQARRELGASQNCVALYAGLHGIAQGLDQVVKAASLVRDLEDLRIVFVGDGPEKEELIEQAQALKLSNVRFLKPFPREAMPALVASADIAIVPLKLRLPGAVPSKLYEAMGAGLPIVLVADGEAAEIVQSTQSGVVVQPGDIDGLASALRDFVTHPDKRQQSGVYGRQSAVKLFDRQTIADAFIDHLAANIR
jgi:glycosyltransferase involved in cell wall biosynthesis